MTHVVLPTAQAHPVFVVVLSSPKERLVFIFTAHAYFRYYWMLKLLAFLVLLHVPIEFLRDCLVLREQFLNEMEINERVASSDWAFQKQSSCLGVLRRKVVLLRVNEN